MSLIVLPAALRAALIAGTGPIPIIVGSTPTVEYAKILAKGLRLFLLEASSLAKTSAPAPSQIP